MTARRPWLAIALGIGGLGVLLLLLGLAFVVPKLFHVARGTMQDEMERQRWVASWVAPAPSIAPEIFFPPALGPFLRESAGALDASSSPLGSHPGLQAWYRQTSSSPNNAAFEDSSSVEGRLSFSAFPVDDIDSPQLQNELERWRNEKIGSANRTTFLAGSNWNRTTASTGTETWILESWRVPGWVLVLETRDPTLETSVLLRSFFEKNKSAPRIAPDADPALPNAPNPLDNN